MNTNEKKKPRQMWKRLRSNLCLKNEEKVAFEAALNGVAYKIQMLIMNKNS